MHTAKTPSPVSAATTATNPAQPHAGATRSPNPPGKEHAAQRARTEAPKNPPGGAAGGRPHPTPPPPAPTPGDRAPPPPPPPPRLWRPARHHHRQKDVKQDRS